MFKTSCSYSILFFLIFFAFTANGQLDYTLSILADNDQTGYFKDKKTDYSFKSEKTLQEQLINIFQELHKENYYSASLDELIKVDSTNFNAKIYVGPQYNLTEINRDQFDSLTLVKIKSVEELFLLQKEKLQKYQQEGYVFAKASLDSINIENESIKGKLIFDPGKQIYLDTIELHGDLKLRPNYLYQYLQFKKGALLDLEKFKSINGRLEELSFLQLEKEPGLSFFDKWASIHIHAKNKNASRFDFIFGIIPTDQVAGQNLFISVDLTAEMVNKLGFGEYLFFEFERLRPEQQSLHIKANYPYLLDLPIALDGNFRIFRNALNYLNVDAEAGLMFLLSHRNFIKILWNSNSSRLIEVDSSILKLPIDLDLSQKGLGLEFEVNALDYKFNPRSGFKANFKITGGKKTIIENETIKQIANENENFIGGYDDLQLESFGLNINTKINYFHPLAQRATINLGLKTGWRHSGSQLLRNELYQIGGYKTLRGFDEASIFTSTFFISTIEYRLLISKNSYFTLPFVDLAYIKNNDKYEMAYGFGGGLSFETGIGLFNFSIAAGQLGDSIPLDLGKPKAHFGFVSLF